MFEELLLLGEKLNNYVEDATTNFDSTTTHKLTVPTGMRWFLFGGNVNRDANETLKVSIFDSSDKKILALDSQAAGTGVSCYPNTVASKTVSQPPMFYILDAGEYIYFEFGGAQGAAAFLSAVVIEVPML